MVSAGLPKGVLLGAAALIGVVLLLVAGGRLTGVGTLSLAPPQAAMSRDLRFDSQNDGSIVISDAETDRLIEVLEPGSGGFIRGILRGLGRERRQNQIDEAAPFRLILGHDNRLQLFDPSTGRLISLHAFGAGNAEAFARLLTLGRDRQ
jgi:putative photosynthetic complex assembly protein